MSSFMSSGQCRFLGLALGPRRPVLLWLAFNSWRGRWPEGGRWPRARPPWRFVDRCCWPKAAPACVWLALLGDVLGEDKKSPMK